MKVERSWIFIFATVFFIICFVPSTYRCTQRIDSQCKASQNGTSLRWLSSQEDCLAIIAVKPEFVPVQSMTEVRAKIFGSTEKKNGKPLQKNKNSTREFSTKEKNIVR